MNEKSKFSVHLLFALTFIFISLILYHTITSFSTGKASDKVKVGMILDGDRHDSGWNEVNAEGIIYAGDRLGFELQLSDNINGSARMLYETVKKMADSGCNAIVLSSENFEQMMEEYAGEFSDVTFFCNAPSSDILNFVSYSSRIYQARYLSGIIAGLVTRSGSIGYVAARPDVEVNRGINAFTLGVQSVNADARINVMFTGSYSDPEMEKKLSEKLIRKYGCDIISVHSNVNNAFETVINENAYYIGSHKPVISPKELASVDTDWGKVYTDLFREYLKGNVVSNSAYWYGLEGDYVKLGYLSRFMDDSIRKKVEAERERIAGGRDVFSNMIKDNEGNLICRSGENMPDERLIEDMDWYVRGVKILDDSDQ